VQALRLLNVHQASLIHHSDVLARGRVRQSAKHNRRRTRLLLNNPVFLALVALLRHDHVPHHCTTVPDGCASSQKSGVVQHGLGQSTGLLGHNCCKQSLQKVDEVNQIYLRRGRHSFKNHSE
jgi:hypothetical protein